MRHIVVALISLVVLCKLLYNNAIEGKHDALFFIKAHSCREASQYFLLGSFIIVLTYKEKLSAMRIIKACGATFCYMASILALYCFMPMYVVIHIHQITNIFYDIWTAILICLTIFYLICLKFKLA